MVNCPLCKTVYGFPDHELKETIDKDNHKQYTCEVLHKHFCEHMLSATRKDKGNFACQSCDDPIDQCNCYDCMGVFCQTCKTFIDIDCSEVDRLIEHNEETK